MIKAPWWVWLSVVVCAALSSVSLVERHKMETGNRAVGLMMEMSDIEAIAVAAGVSRPDALAALQRRGLTGVAISEDSIGDLVRRGRLVLDTDGNSLIVRAVGDDAGRWTQPNAVDQQYLGNQFQRDLYHLERAALALSRRGLFDLGVVNVPFGTRYPTSISVDRDKLIDISSVPVGIDPRAAYDAKQAGLVVVARHFNEVGADGDLIARALRDSKNAGATAFLIGGDQALGNRLLIDQTEVYLRNLGMHYLSPEFVTLGGDAKLRAALADQTIRLHSITQQEAEQMPASEVEERFAKAYRERAIRWMLLRPSSKASNDALASTGALLAGVRAAIISAGGEVKEPRPYTEPKPQQWLLGAIAVAALPAVLWAVFSVFGFGVWGILLGVASLGLSVGAFVDSYRELSALMVAVAFPVAGFLAAVPRDGSPKRTYPLFAYLVMSAFSLVAGMAVGGMLIGVDYTIRVQQFAGVKLALFVPILLVGWILLSRMGPVRETFARPVSWLAAVLSIGALVIIAMMALRSGNENPAAVSSFELQIRSMLDNLLHVRPRTKEVVFGHPLLVVGLCLLAYRPGAKGWVALCLVAGMVGQTSIVNTMCHLHTPALLSLTRIGVGLALGGIIGLLAWAVINRLAPSKEPL